MALGDYIANRRKQLRLTQQEVADRLESYGVARTASAIATWETGKQSVPLEIIPELAKALETSLVDLYSAAGVLDDLPGARIIKIMDKLSDRSRANITRMIEAYTEENSS